MNEKVKEKESIGASSRPFLGKKKKKALERPIDEDGGFS